MTGRVEEGSGYRYDHDESGRRTSPVLTEDIRNFLIDIDGTVCDDVPNEEPERMKEAEPFKGAVDFVNGIYIQGHVVTFFTSRTEDLRSITEDWLVRHGFKYHGLLMGKPRGGHYHWIDNHEVRFTKYEGKFGDFVTVQGEIIKFED